MPSDPAAQPTFTYRGQDFLWGYSPDRQTCGLWRADDPAGEAHHTWPISEHEAAWRVFRSLEPNATECSEAPAASPTSVETVGSTRSSSAPAQVQPSPTSALADAAPAASSDVSNLADPRKRLRRIGLVALVSAAVALAAVMGLWAFRPTSSSPSSSPAAVAPARAVLTAASTTERLDTAEMSMTETITFGSKTLTVPASGVVEFGSGAGSLSMTVDGQHITVESSDGALYMSIPQISQVVPGKSWVLVPMTSSGSAAGGALSGGDPAQMLQFLASKGNTESSLGPTTMGGVAVQAYSVLIDKSAVESTLAGSGLPAGIVQAADQFLQSVGPISFTVFVDSANQLRGMDFSMSVPGTSGATVSARMTFRDFGVPVSLVPPPASQVASLQEFLDATQQAVGS